MKRTIIATAAALMAALATGAETFYVATLTDFAGEKSFSVVTREEAKALEQKTRAQNSLLPKVIGEMQRDFNKNRDPHSHEKFYGGKMKAKRLILSPPIQGMDKANAKADKMREREENKDVDDSKKGKKKKKPTASEQERAYRDSQREYAIQQLAEEIEKRIDELLSTPSDK